MKHSKLFIATAQPHWLLAPSSLQGQMAKRRLSLPPLTLAVNLQFWAALLQQQTAINATCRLAAVQE